MKHYKEEWWAKTGDEDRKKIATQMASTTKSWVSASQDQIAAEEKAEKKWSPWLFDNQLIFII